MRNANIISIAFACFAFTSCKQNKTPTCIDQKCRLMATHPAGSKYLLPTAFTPNGDGRNDVFRILPAAALNASSYEIHILDGKGEVIYAMYKDTPPWNGVDSRTGKPCNPGCYDVVFGAVSKTDTDSFSISADGFSYVSLLSGHADGCLDLMCLSEHSLTFEDQVDPKTGYRIMPTAENICD